MNSVLLFVLSVGLPAIAVSVVELSKQGQSAALDGALMGAAGVAGDRGHSELLPEHFLLAAMMDDEAAEVVMRWGIPRSEAIRALLDRIDTVAATRPPGAELTLSAAVDAALRRAPRHRRTLTLPAVVREFEPLVVALRTEPSAEREAPPASANYRERGTTLHVVVHDNPRTRVDAVIGVLIDVLGIDRTSALCLAYRIHCVGATSVGTWPTPEAIELAERARLRSTEVGFPLEVSTPATFQTPRESLSRWLWRRAGGTASRSPG